MKFPRRAFVIFARTTLALSLALPMTASVAGGADPDQTGWPDASKYTNRLIVKMKAPAKGVVMSASEGAQIASAMSVAAGRALSFSHETGVGAAILTTDTQMTLAEASRVAQRLLTQADVEYAEPDVRMFPALVPNDTQYAADQWALKAVAVGNYGINAPAAWDITTGAASVIVAVLDTGITAHIDLAGRTVPGYDFVTSISTANDVGGRDADPSDPGDWITAAESATLGGPFQGCRVKDSSWHGTHVSGTIGAISDNSLGIAGVNWVSKIQPIRVLGKCGGVTSDIADAMTWASGGVVAGVANNPTPANVLNLSLGGLSPCGLTYQTAINGAISRGVLVVVAAGNEFGGAMGASPANCQGVIAVSATNISGARPTFSNYGPPATISAPGDNVISTLNTGLTTPVAAPGGSNYVNYFGTSMATPHVAAVASLMLSVRPTLLPHHVAAMIRGTATPYPTAGSALINCQIQRCGDGILNAAAAVAAAQACVTPPTIGAPAAISETCNGDLDGNGVVHPLTDGLLATRMALGVTGTALTQNALGTCATRTTYAAIRAYMNRNCGTQYP